MSIRLHTQPDLSSFQQFVAASFTIAPVFGESGLTFACIITRQKYMSAVDGSGNAVGKAYPIGQASVQRIADVYAAAVANPAGPIARWLPGVQSGLIGFITDTTTE